MPPHQNPTNLRRIDDAHDRLCEAGAAFAALFLTIDSREPAQTLAGIDRLMDSLRQARNQYGLAVRDQAVRKVSLA